MHRTFCGFSNEWERILTISWDVRGFVAHASMYRYFRLVHGGQVSGAGRIRGAHITGRRSGSRARASYTLLIESGSIWFGLGRTGTDPSPPTPSPI